MDADFKQSSLSGYDLQKMWEQGAGAKGDLETRCERYARWTLPYICPKDGTADTADIATAKGHVAIGARLINHLANRLVDVMFPADRAFFSLPLSSTTRRKIMAAAPDEVTGGKEILALKKATTQIVDDKLLDLNMTKYRPVAVDAVKHVLITGGAKIRRHKDETRSVYGIKDSVDTRDARGVLTSTLLRDTKAYGHLSPSQQATLDAADSTTRSDDTIITIYTYFEFNGSKWEGIQSLDAVLLPNTYDTYTVETMPVLDLTWNLSRGDTYPRGAVEDHEIWFHNIDVTSLAIIDLIGIAADIKYLVDPSSLVDVEELNNAPRGQYVLGRVDDVGSIEFGQRMELITLIEQVQAWERQLSQTFLLNNGTVRDAERVTAEEIRASIRELESAFGGIYSKLALDWQKREAEYLMSSGVKDASGDTKRIMDNFDVVVTTGVESLSREGQMDNLRLAMADLQMLDTVPDTILGTIDVRAFTEFVFTNRGVMLAQFVLSEDQVAANTAAAQKAQQEQMNAENSSKAAAGAAQAAANGA